MTKQAFLELFSTTAFIEEEIDDNSAALILELDPDGDYLQLTDDLGFFPTAVESPLILAYYTAEGAFRWAKEFKDAQPILTLYAQAATAHDFADRVLAYEPPAE